MTMSITNESPERDVDELEREVDQSRAQVAHTLDELQSQVTETIDEWRSRLTAQEITRELKSYARDSTRRFARNMGRSIGTRIRDNPASAVAMGAAAAWPLYRIAKKIPLPVYVIGAGVALMRPLMNSRDDDQGYAPSRLRDDRDVYP